MNTLALAVRLAARGLRGGLKGFRLFVACLALGVAAIAGVGMFSDAVVAGLKANARELLGGDVDIRLHNRTMDPDALAYVERRTEKISVALDMRAMASPLGGNGKGRERALVELKAVDGAYPLLGALTLGPPMASDLTRCDTEQFGRGHIQTAFTRGRSRRNTVPRPSDDCTSISPSCTGRIRYTIDRPSPVP